jgi:xanthine dehydrogenase accessory factor
MKNIYIKIPDLQHYGSGVVLATVTGTKGSTPQKEGSSALFENGKLLAGTVGGGIVEGKVQEAAGIQIQSKRSLLLRFTLDNEVSKKDEAICGGEINILLDANPFNNLHVFQSVKEAFLERIPGVLITMVTVASEDQVLINRYWMTHKVKPQLPAEFMEVIETEADKMLSSPDNDCFKEVRLSIPDQEPSSVFFLERILPPPHLVIAGAGHIGRALSHLGKMLNFNVTIIDDRAEFANKEWLPEADQILTGDIGVAVREVVKNDNTFIVIVTRGHNDDANALRPCIGSDAAYVGMIGSKVKIAKMHTDFIRNKWATEEQWGRVYTPIGLDIRSETVEEIAVSIAAQLIQVKNSRRQKTKVTR